MADIIPTDKGSKKDTFTALSASVALDEKVLALLLTSPMDNLEDLRFYFTEEKEIDAFVATDNTITDSALRLQVSRLRRAWSSVRQTALQRDSRQSTSAVAELDDLLSEADLRGVKIQFWKRYQMKYPAQIMPCDQIISRCFRKVDIRLLTVHDIWKARSLEHEVTTSRKRKQVGDGLYTFEEEAYADPTHTVSVY